MEQDSGPARCGEEPRRGSQHWPRRGTNAPLRLPGPRPAGLAAWAAAVEMTPAGAARDAALAAAPATKGARAGLAVRPRDLSCGRATRPS